MENIWIKMKIVGVYDLPHIYSEKFDGRVILMVE